MTTSENTTYYYLGGKMVAMRKDAILSYIHQDHLSGTALVTSDNGSVLGSVTYYPFGGARSGSVNTDKLFTGQRLDNTGLYYYGARFYDPEIGRFISADSMVSRYWNPQALNRYSYALNNPLKYVDPTGHQHEDPGGEPEIVLSEGDIVWTVDNSFSIIAGGEQVSISVDLANTLLGGDSSRDSGPDLPKEPNPQPSPGEPTLGTAPPEPAAPPTTPGGGPTAPGSGGTVGGTLGTRQTNPSLASNARNNTGSQLLGMVIFIGGVLATTILVCVAASAVTEGPPGWLAAQSLASWALVSYAWANMGFLMLTEGKYALPAIPRRLP